MRNNKGFGIVGLMAMIAIMTIVMMAAGTLMQDMIKASNMAEAKSSLVSLSQDINNVAANDISCTAAITQVAQTMVGEIQFVLPNGRTIKQGLSTLVYPLNVTSFVYANSALVVSNPDGSKVYYGDLIVQVSPSKLVLGPSVFKPRSVKSVYLTINPSGIIVSCGNVSPQPSIPPQATTPQATTPQATTPQATTPQATTPNHENDGHDNGSGNNYSNNGAGNCK